MSGSLLVAAIDFGTTYSTWGFSFKHDYDRDPTSVTVKQWQGLETVVSLKGPTSVLIKPDGKTLHSFGFDAESMYAELAEENEHKSWYYFRRFKMQLYDKMGMQGDFTIQDATGKSLPAKMIFSLSIKYIKDDLMEMLKKHVLVGGVRDSDIRWVLTVPAIWNDVAKQFMREAAEHAGVNGGDLTIALEPEAASLYCRHLPGYDSLKMMKTGSKYLILDAGGGTVDITVHEISSDGNLKEIHKANGGDWGGTKVDQAFENFLSEITGDSLWEKFKENAMEDYLDLMRSFEIKKRLSGKDTDRKDISIRIPFELISLTKEITGMKLPDKIASSKYANNVKLTGDKLKIDLEIMKSFFEESFRNIVKHLKELFKTPKVEACEVILMVGGYSESCLLQKKITTCFPEKKIVVPNDAGIAVLKGAVIYGHNPTLVAERVCKFTYGNQTFPNRFAVHVRNGDTVKLGEEQPEKIFLFRPFQTEAKINLYCTKDRNPTTVDDEGCIKLGTVTVPDTTGWCDRKVGVSFLFRGTEIEVTVRNKEKGTEKKLSIPFC